ncbi:MAG: hypothetical protein ACHQCI_01350 [Solirubrobacterales bacterium]
MIRRALWGVALAATSFLLAPTLTRANPLDIPAAAPPQFRALLREKLHTSRGSFASESRIDLNSQHGYRLVVIGEGNVVALAVMRDGRPRSATSHRPRSFSQVLTGYVTRGTATPTRIKGSFGSFGSIDVRFRPSGRVVTDDPRRCGGRDHFTYRYGTFVGRIRFTGENHYIAVRAHRAKGRVRSPLHLHCRRYVPVPLAQRGRSTKNESLPYAALTAEHREVTASTGLLVLRSGRRALLLALQEENLGRMAEVRYGLMLTESNVLRHNEALTAATLSPPRPFHGKGIYHAAPDGTTSWTGSLSIAFPGAPRLPLTGTDFAMELEAGF